MRDGLPPLRDVIRQYGLRAERKLGQNFLLDLNLTQRIARTAGDLSECSVIEIGPGPGGLTRALLEAGARHVYAIEKDERCLRALQDIDVHFPGRLSVINADALEVDPGNLCGPPRKIVANLPYNIATPLLLGWLRDPSWFKSLTLMFQKEVAERLNAVPRTKAYGRLSVMAQWRCEVRRAFDIPADAFTPKPKVTSSVVSFTPRGISETDPDWNSMERVVAQAFGQRRKMLRTTLKPLELAPEDFGIAPTARAEELSVADFVRFARALEA